jgi:glycosyltransferase involved in cell wall biosynthesis
VFRVKGFVDNIVWNIENIDYPNLEFIISDRHLHDDAIDLLRERLPDDERVRFVADNEELSWIENFNFVVTEARGKYFRWLAQDDRLIGGLMDAVAILESDPECVIAYGGLELVAMDGRSLSPGRSHLTRGCSDGSRWGFGQALLILGNLCHREAVVGLVRRGVVIDWGLLIKPAYRHEGRASGTWLFGMSLAGTFRYVNQYRNRKGVHRAQTGASNWKVGWRHHWSYFRVACEYLAEVQPRWRLLSSTPVALMALVLYPATVVAHRFRRRRRLSRQARS